MKNMALLFTGATMLLASCDINEPGQILGEVPEEITEIAAPYQDLSSVRIDPADGCYTYLHAGPVESTYLPLRTTSGSPICSRQPDAEAEAEPEQPVAG